MQDPLSPSLALHHMHTTSRSHPPMYTHMYTSPVTTTPTRRYLVLITGASRGFGKSLALEVAKKWGPQYALDMHLIARSQSGLLATQQEVENEQASQTHTNKDHLRIWTWPIDLGDLKTLPSKLEPVFAQVKAPPSSSAYSKAYLFNNAGLVGPIGYTQDLAHDLPALQQSIDLNLTSFIYLTSLFLKHFGAPRQDVPSSSASPASSASPSLSSSSVIVNVSSLAAVQPFESWGVYCAGKAARDMFTQVVAQEQQQQPQPQPETDTASASAPTPPAPQAPPLLKTLNYAPGPLDTDMQTELRESKEIHRPTRDWSMEAFKEGKLVQPEASAAKCLEILTKDTFKSGAHIDYYDEI